MKYLAAIAFLWVSSFAHAQTLLDETSTIVSPTAASAVLREFDITSAGTYELQLTDFKVPAALTGERAAIVRDGVIVRSLALGDLDTATATFEATAGRYSLSIVATPATGALGTVGALVRRGAEAPVLELAESIALPNPPPPGTRQTLDTAFQITVAGQYRASLIDVGFPAALRDARLAVVPQGGAPIVDLLSPGSATFDATPGTYRLFVLANAEAVPGAGVFFAEVISPSSGVSIYRSTVPVGAVTQLGAPLLAAGTHSLVGADLSLPTPLAAMKLAVTSRGQIVSRLDAAGTTDFQAAAGGHEVLAAASAASGTAGSFVADLRRGDTPVANFVSTASDGASQGAITFTGLVAAAGTYRLRLTDFAFPQTFTGLRAAVTQNGVNLANLTAAGTTDVVLAPGTVRVLVFAQANATTGNGLYGVELSPPAGGSPIVEGTYGVGSAFGAWVFAVNSAGRYRVTADDLEFPERFAGFDAVITRGPDVIGSFFGGGSFVFSATPGRYAINFIARPGAQSGGAGTFRVRVADAPALPTLALRASATTVDAGTATRLQWTATDATSCVASGAWSGPRPATGSETTSALSAQSTFNLECTGPGGSISSQVVVAVNAPGTGSGKGGGGRLGEYSLLLLLGVATVRALRRREFRTPALPSPRC